MTTTSQFQTKPDFFSTKEVVKKSNSNPRYLDFNQTHFTAGDVEQFELYRDKSNGNGPSIDTIDLSNNVWHKLEIKDPKVKSGLVGENIDWKKYKNLTTESVDNTFAYLFNKFKKGVFIKIKNNKLDVFLPFSKHNFVNEWSEYIKQPPSYKDITEFLIYASKIQGYKIDPSNINKFINKWYANNCLLRSEFPVGENDRCMSNLKDMLTTLCEQRVVPDIELFFNRRDFPLIKRDETEPYEHIFNTEKLPLLTHKYDKYCPILSMVTTNSNTDIPFPTMEDWARVSSQEHSKLFAPDFKEYKCNFNHIWNTKIPTAIFRGASTGCGVTIETNPRLKLAQLSLSSPVVSGIPLLDAGIVKWNCRPRKIMGQDYLQIIDPTKLNLPLVPFLSPEQQSNYKYIVNVDGHVSAFRLSLELSMGSVLLLQDSKYRVWFRKYLIPNVHYIPIKEDLSDLFDQIRWCRSHDKECQEIAKNALTFYNTYLTEKGILDFVQLLFINIKRVTGTYFYNCKSVKNILYEKEYEQLDSIINEDIVNVNYPYDTRNIDAMAGLEIYFQRHSIPLKQLLVSNPPPKKEHESKDSIITTYQLDKLRLSLKTSKRKCELVNEAFIGIECINKLLHEIPNFKYTFGFDKKSSTLITEHIEGVSLNDFINGLSFVKGKQFVPPCSISEFICVIQVLLLTLAVAQERYGFVHHDLTPWNIIIRKLDKKETIVYQFKDQRVMVETTILPIIIDYDKSHAIINELHYGIIDPFKTSKFQDCFCLIITSIYEYCKSHKKMIDSEFHTILHIINFLTNTEFRSKEISTYDELLDFLTQNKKYNEIVYRNKCDLEMFDPCDYFSYINTLFESKTVLPSQNIIIKFVPDGTKIKKENTYVNPLFYYELLTDKNNHQSILTYLEKVENIMKQHMDKFVISYVYYIHTMNKIYQTVSNLKQFIQTNPCPQKTQEELWIEIRNCDRILTHISTDVDYKEIKPSLPVCHHISETIVVKGKDDVLYCKLCEKEVEKNKKWKSKLTISPTFYQNFNIAKYNVTTFSIPGTILTLLQGDYNIQNTNYITIRNMIRDTLLYSYPFEISDEKDFAKTYGKLLRNFCPLALLNHNANIKTLNFISKQIYPSDLIELEKHSDAEKSVVFIKNIISLL